MPYKRRNYRRSAFRRAQRMARTAKLEWDAGTASFEQQILTVAQHLPISQGSQGLLPPLRISNIRIDVQALAPSNFATADTTALTYPHDTVYGYALVHRKAGAAAGTIQWYDETAPLCSIPSQLMAFGIFPVNQEVAEVRVRGCNLQQGDDLLMIVQNLTAIPANLSGFPNQNEFVISTVSYNYQ